MGLSLFLYGIYYWLYTVAISGIDGDGVHASLVSQCLQHPDGRPPANRTRSNRVRPRCSVSYNHYSVGRNVRGLSQLRSVCLSVANIASALRRAHQQYAVYFCTVCVQCTARDMHSNAETIKLRRLRDHHLHHHHHHGVGVASEALEFVSLYLSVSLAALVPT